MPSGSIKLSATNVTPICKDRAWWWPDETCAHELPRVECPQCTPQVAPAVEVRGWRRWLKLPEFLPPQKVVASLLRILQGGLVLLVGGPIVALFHVDLLDKAVHIAGTIAIVLGIWGIALPIESAINEPLAEKIWRWIERRLT